MSSTDFGVFGVVTPFLWLAAGWLPTAVLTALSLAAVYEVVKVIVISQQTELNERACANEYVIELKEYAGSAQCFHFQKYTHIVMNSRSISCYICLNIGYFGNLEPITPRICNFGYLSEKVLMHGNTVSATSTGDVSGSYL